MIAGEVVIHIMQRDRVNVVFDLFAVRVGQARKASHAHSHREVLTFDIRR